MNEKEGKERRGKENEKKETDGKKKGKKGMKEDSLLRGRNKRRKKYK